MDNAQMSQNGPAKTIRLPSGEVIHDLDGEWDAILTYPGLAGEGVLDYNQIIKITQKGKSFEGVLMMDDEWCKKGYILIDGKLAKGNFEYVHLILIPRITTASGQISEDGKRIVFDDGEIARFILTRK